jgi:hypothetical protein
MRLTGRSPNWIKVKNPPDRQAASCTNSGSSLLELVVGWLADTAGHAAISAKIETECDRLRNDLGGDGFCFG